jgi:type II secretory pathway pseudopilin PulG
MLTVIGIISLLAVLTVPSVVGLSTSDKFDSAVSGLSETLSLARQTAVARNTYVWVAFAVPVNPTDTPLSTLVIASTDGTNPFDEDWSATVKLPDPRFYVVSKASNYTRCQFVDAGVLTPQQIPSLPSQGDGDTNGLASQLNFVVNSPGGTMTYSRVIEYAPTGVVYNGLNPVNFVEFGIEPGRAPSPTVTNKNVALFRMPFITGKAVLYRP